MPQRVCLSVHTRVLHLCKNACCDGLALCSSGGCAARKTRRLAKWHDWCVITTVSYVYKTFSPHSSDKHPPSPGLSFYPAEGIREGYKWQLSILELWVKNKSLRQGLTGLRTGRGLLFVLCIYLFPNWALFSALLPQAAGKVSCEQSYSHLLKWNVMSPC